MNIGRERSVSVANAIRDREIAETSILQARSEALPSLTAKGTYSRLDELQEFDLGSGPASIGSLDNYAVSVAVNQLLYSGGRVRAALRAAGLSREYSDLGRKRALAAAERDIAVSFNGVLLARDAVAVAEESEKLLHDIVDHTEKKFRQGAAARLDLIGARVRLANERTRTVAARNGMQLAMESLRTVAALGDEPFDVTGAMSFEPVEWQLTDLLAAAETNRSEILELRVVADMMDQDAIAARAQGRPSLRASFVYQGANSYSMVPFDNEWQWHWTAMAYAEWPLFDGLRTSASVHGKELEAEKTRAQLEDLVRGVRLEVRSAHSEMTHARESISAGTEAVALAEEGRNVAEAAYDAGAATALELAEANVALKAARFAYLKALHDHSVALLKLRYACGMPIVEKD